MFFINTHHSCLSKFLFLIFNYLTSTSSHLSITCTLKAVTDRFFKLISFCIKTCCSLFTFMLDITPFVIHVSSYCSLITVIVKNIFCTKWSFMHSSDVKNLLIQLIDCVLCFLICSYVIITVSLLTQWHLMDVLISAPSQESIIFCR